MFGPGLVDRIGEIEVEVSTRISKIEIGGKNQENKTEEKRACLVCVKNAQIQWHRFDGAMCYVDHLL